jgi:protein required for attachment to host cells
MSTSIRVPYGTWVVVADARKALQLFNEGDEHNLDLRVRQTINAPANERTSSQGSDRPGRAFSGSRRSAVDQADWHRLAETQFAASVVKTMFGKEQPHAVILVAPPAFLAELRKHLPARVMSALIAEIDKDLTHLPVAGIARHLLHR